MTSSEIGRAPAASLREPIVVAIQPAPSGIVAQVISSLQA